MQLFINQKLISLKGRFFISDANGNDVYEAQGKVFALGRHLTLSDIQGHELLKIRQKIVSLHHTYFITPTGGEEMELIQKIVSIKPHFYLNALGWEISGGITAHDYTIYKGEEIVAQISKQLVAAASHYAIDITHDEDAVNVIGTVLALDCVNADNISSSASSAST